MTAAGMLHGTSSLCHTRCAGQLPSPQSRGPQHVARQRRGGTCIQAASEVAETDRIAAVRVETTRRITQLVPSFMGRAGRPREATLQLAEMARLGVQPDAMAATALVDACARNGKMDMALSVFDELFGDFLQPDDITFSTLVRGYGESEPPQWSGISTVLATMQQRFGMRPDTAVYTSLLSICARTKDDDRGYEIIERMARTGVEPDDQVLDAVGKRKSLRSHLRRVYTSASAGSGEAGGMAEGSTAEVSAREPNEESY